MGMVSTCISSVLKIHDRMHETILVHLCFQLVVCPTGCLIMCAFMAYTVGNK